MPGDAPGLRTLNPRTGPPIAAFAEARPGVICVLLLATPAAGLTGNLLLLETSRALAGALPIGVVFERSTPADRGPSATPTHECKFLFDHQEHPYSLIAGITGGTVALRRSPLEGLSKKTPAGEIPLLRRVTPENAVLTSLISEDATSFYIPIEKAERGKK